MSSMPEHTPSNMRYRNLTVCVEGVEGEGSVMEAGRRAFPLCYQQERIDLSERTSGLGRCWVLDQEREGVEDAFAEVCSEKQKRDM